MVTSKSLKSKSFIFGTLNPGAVLIGYGWRHDGKVVTLDEGISHRLCFSVDKYPFCFDSSEWNDDNIMLELCWDDADWYVNPTDVTEIKIPAMKKEFRAQAVAGSVWRFTKDWTVDGYLKGPSPTVPAGTEFKIKGNKMPRVRFYTHEDTALEIHEHELLDSIFPSRYCTGTMIPAKEASQYIELVTPGKTKTYWVVENDEGERLLPKRYKGLGNIKASIRVRIGIDANDGEDDEYIPEWVSDGDRYMEQLPLDNGLWAVEYDYMSNKELKREDMLEYYTMRKLTQ